MIHGLVRRRRRRLLLIAAALAPAVLLGALALVVQGPSLLWNRSESEPQGLYIRSTAAPSLGQIIAFPAPPSVLTYASGRMAYLRHMPILKEVAAMSGDTVCTRDGKLVINGVWRAPVLAHDGESRPLPRWRACRRLGEGEFFVFSNRIPNSFDSRYYGPVRREAIVGVFRPIMTQADRPGDV